MLCRRVLCLRLVPVLCLRLHIFLIIRLRVLRLLMLIFRMLTQPAKPISNRVATFPAELKDLGLRPSFGLVPFKAPIPRTSGESAVHF